MADRDRRDREVGEPRAVQDAYDRLPGWVAELAGPELRIVTANAGYRAIAGGRELVGLTMRETVPGIAGQRVFEVVERVYATGEPAIHPEWRLQADTVEGDVFMDLQIYPVRDGDGAITGVLSVGMDATERVRQRQAAEARAAEAEARYAEARDMIDAMQRELLPPGLPVLPGARIAASYLLAEDEGAAGGDWFDALALPGGRVGLVVGDVVGHGVGASAVMGQLRAVLAERLEEAGDLHAAMAAADRMARRVPGARAATVCVVVLDPADGSMTYCTAGHPPPLVVSTAGEFRYLEITGATPLGVAAAGEGFALGVGRLGVGEVVVLYSDGIIERPGRELSAATVELGQVAADAVSGRVFRHGESLSVERACVQTLEVLVRATGHSDDITLLAAERTEPAPDFHLSAAAGPSSVRDVRVELGGWLEQLGVGDDDRMAIQHAVGELVTNAVEHAYAGAAGGRIDVRATLGSGGVLEAAVSDAGRWRDGPAVSGRGRGLTMARHLVDEVEVARGEAGTTVSVRQRVGRPARLLRDAESSSGVAAPARRGEGSELLIVLDQPASPRPTVRVDGPVDATTAPTLGAELAHRRAGTEPLTVDLTNVTHLASAGVAALFEATADHQTSAPLVLYAPPGSPADHILSLVSLPHATSHPASDEE